MTAFRAIPFLLVWESEAVLLQYVLTTKKKQLTVSIIKKIAEADSIKRDSNPKIKNRYAANQRVRFQLS